MRHLSKFFTPPLNESDRNSIWRALGLSAVPYLFVERFGKQVLCVETRNDISHSLVGLTPEDLTFWVNSEAFAFTVLMDHAVQNATTQRVATLKGLPGTPQSLWDALIPFPCRLYKPGDTGRGFQISVVPQSAEAGMNRLFDRLLELELLLAEREVSLLWLRSGESRFPILFHFVRGRMVRAGTSPRLYELGNQFDSGELASDGFSQIMGTRAAMVCVNIPSGSAGNVWDRLDQGFSAAIRDLNIQPPLPTVPPVQQESRL